MPHPTTAAQGRGRRVPSRRIFRRDFADDVIVLRDWKKYATVRAVAKPKPKHRGVPVPSLPRQSKSRTISRRVVQRSTLHRRRKVQLKSILVTAAVSGIFVAGAILTFDGWRANRTVEAQAQAMTKAANSAGTGGSNVAAPSTNRPDQADLASYVVPANQPRYLIIGKLGVKARVKSLGVDKNGQLQTPNNVFDTGWYNGSALPGQKGAMLIDGHVSSWTTNGVFYGLKTLRPGDTLQVVRGDGATFTYKVVKSQVYNADNVDMGAALSPVVAGKPGLNLITCTGQVKPGTSEFNQRVVVFTEQL